MTLVFTQVKLDDAATYYIQKIRGYQEVHTNWRQWNENVANLNVLNKSNWENNVCRKYIKTRCLNRTGEIEGTFSCDTQTWIQEFQKCSLYRMLKIDQYKWKKLD